MPRASVRCGLQEPPVDVVRRRCLVIQNSLDWQRRSGSHIAELSAELTDLGKGQVYVAAQRLKEKADLTVVIEGHADAAGNEEYNQKLGQRRAQVVMKELSAQGIDPNRMSAASVGESKPLIDQDAQWARAVNRRVEFQVQGAR